MTWNRWRYHKGMWLWHNWKIENTRMTDLKHTAGNIDYCISCLHPTALSKPHDTDLSDHLSIYPSFTIYPFIPSLPVTTTPFLAKHRTSKVGTGQQESTFRRHDWAIWMFWCWKTLKYEPNTLPSSMCVVHSTLSQYTVGTPKNKVLFSQANHHATSS